ncbi:MAG: HD domain-containing protein [Dehalococcoidia bacterium]|nr:HD domain-containing protein [Dehalococcoidia bacterium]
MIRETHVSLLDMALCFSNALDMVNPALVNHHKRVASIAVSCAEALRLPLKDQSDLMIAGLLHDIGAIEVQERLDLLRYDEGTDVNRHAEIGYLVLRLLQPLSDITSLVRYHHVPWRAGAGAQSTSGPVPMGSHILHLADRVAVLLGTQTKVLGQAREVMARIVEGSGDTFVPEQVEALHSAATKESFWLDATSPSLDSLLSARPTLATMVLDMEGILQFSRLVSHLIDFRSPFTASHSSGVATSAEMLARLAGFSSLECQMMLAAGYLHDLGKLLVPQEILEKPAKLTEDEFNVIRSHTYHTYRNLEPLGALDTINTWAAFHHERLDGRGYPFKLKGDDIPLGSRIMAVADTFAAIAEDRPYRKGMTVEKAIETLDKMVVTGALDANVVSLLKLNYHEMDAARATAQEEATKKFLEFRNL